VHELALERDARIPTGLVGVNVLVNDLALIALLVDLVLVGAGQAADGAGHWVLSVVRFTPFYMNWLKNQASQE
jgi:hypothetical protein